jgi:lipopolysaccharide transport system ATP-binding protein
MCDRSIVLKRGSVDFDGDTREGIGRYLSDAVLTGDGEVDLRDHPMRRGNALPLLESIRLLDASNMPATSFAAGEKIHFEFTFNPVVNLEKPEFGIGVDDSGGLRIFSLATYLSNSTLPPLRTPCKVVCSVDELALAPGRYYLSLSAGDLHNTLIDAIDHAVAFDVEAGDYFGNGRTSTPGLGRVMVRSAWKATA